MNGWLIVNKPIGISSAGVTNKLKRFCNKQKIGHAGTLDPFASGMLIVAVGGATKLIDYVMNQRKSYDFTILWGKSTDTIDCTGKDTEISSYMPSEDAIEQCIKIFPKNSMIAQVPPQYSAVHIDGKRAYSRARSGETFELAEREVFLESISILSHHNHSTDFNVKCGKGFYVRSLARDIASLLSACGHVSYLRRVAVGKFSQIDAIELDYLLQLLHNAVDSHALGGLLMPLNAMLDDILVLHLDGGDIVKLVHGQRVLLRSFEVSDGSNAIVCNADDGRVVAVCTVYNSELIPKRVINY